MTTQTINPDATVLKRSVPEWTAIVNAIQEKMPGLIELRETDHEYRTDDRDIVSFQGQDYDISIDSLPYNLDQADSKKLAQALLKCYFTLKNRV